MQALCTGMDELARIVGAREFGLRLLHAEEARRLCESTRLLWEEHVLAHGCGSMQMRRAANA